MKKNRKCFLNSTEALLMLLLFCVVCPLLPARPVLAVSGDVPGITPAPSVSPVPPPIPDVIPENPKNGWNTMADGRKKYYRQGRYLTGLVSISRRQYFFDKKGYLLRDSWGTTGRKKYRTNKNGVILKDRLVTVDKQVYYLNKNGVMKKGWKTFQSKKSYFGPNGARVTGLQKIGKKRYYFNKKGIMQTGTKKVKSTTYYLNEKGVLLAKKTGSKYYHANGRKMDRLQAQDFETLQTAKSIAARITTPQMTQAQKLKKCFDWVISKPYITYRGFSNFKGWPAVYANDHFIRKGGNCHSDAAAFAYLAKALGYQNVYVCVDSDGRGGLGHGWAEINGLVYDPLFAEAKSYSRNYQVPYGVYILHPILHIRI